MNDDRFDELMRDAAQTYRTPPEPPTSTRCGRASKRAHFGRGTAHRRRRQHTIARRERFAIPRWLGIAATLVIGIGIGRASMRSIGTRRDAAGCRGASRRRRRVARRASTRDARTAPYELETSQYLGQTAALLIALPSEVQGRPRRRAVRGTRRRAADAARACSSIRRRPTIPRCATCSRISSSCSRRSFGCRTTASRTELDLINRALEQRDVIPRLRTAVADISAN